MKHLFLALLLLTALGCEDTTIIQSPTGPDDQAEFTVITVVASVEAVRFTLDTVDLQVTNRHRVRPYRRAYDYTLTLFGNDGTLLRSENRLFPDNEDETAVVVVFDNVTRGGEYQVDVVVRARQSDEENAAFVVEETTLTVNT